MRKATRLPRNCVRKIGILAVALMLLVGSAGCEEADQAVLMGLAEEWARAHKISPTNEDGSVNPEGLANIGIRSLGGSTGDPEADAALDAISIIRRLMAADNPTPTPKP